MLLLFAVSAVQAATVFGTIYQQGKPLPNASIRLDCPWGASTTVTDARGNFRAASAQHGSCTLTVSNGAASASGPVDFYPEPSKHDFEWAPGDPVLRRR